MWEREEKIIIVCKNDKPDTKVRPLGPSNWIIDDLDYYDDKLGQRLLSNLKSDNDFGFRLKLNFH